MAECSAACFASARWAAGAEGRPRSNLPRKKAQKWSTGVAPGEYGRLSTRLKARKYWGGEKEEDPDEYLWKGELPFRIRRLLSSVSGQEAAPPPPFQKDPYSSSGFLSLHRAMSLDSMEVDLSSELASPPKSVLEKQVEAARLGSSVAVESTAAPSPNWRPAPTKREQERWDKEAKAAAGGTDVIIRESSKVRGDPEVMAAQARERYFKLKKKLQLLTAGIGGVGFLSAYFCYSSEVAVSFGAGLLGSLIYLRMLGNSVDSLADGAKGIIKGAASQPRLLVPVALVMIYNRWNGLLVPEHGFMRLELIPMLVGFFTYKIATFVQATEESLAGFGNEVDN